MSQDLPITTTTTRPIKRTTSNKHNNQLHSRQRTCNNNLVDTRLSDLNVTRVIRDIVTSCSLHSRSNGRLASSLCIVHSRRLSRLNLAITEHVRGTVHRLRARNGANFPIRSVLYKRAPPAVAATSSKACALHFSGTDRTITIGNLGGATLTSIGGAVGSFLGRIGARRQRR